MSDLDFAKTINEHSLGVMASSVMSDCEHHGMTYGCTTTCPVLLAGKCEFQDDENKALYEEAIRDE